MQDCVLIIDDNEDLLDFLSDVLGEQYMIFTALNAQRAIKVLEDQYINLIVSDVMMPGLNGFELCRKLKSEIEYCHIPIILLTAKNTYKAKIEGLENGADAYIEKPFSPELLIVQIANLLKNRSKIRDHSANIPFGDVGIKIDNKSDERFLRKVNDFIRKNISNKSLDIEQLADYMNMSRPTFYRRIKSISHVSPKELIDQTRLKKAVELMIQNNLKIYQIAKQVGYSSQSVFGKNFYKYYNQSPLEYLNSMRSKS